MGLFKEPFVKNQIIILIDPYKDKNTNFYKLSVEISANKY